jgi:pilus assembly protein CpaE
MPLSAALLVYTRQLWEQTNAVIQNLPVRIALESNELGDTDDLLDRIERHRADVVLVESNRMNLPLDELVRRLRETTSQPAVFVLHTEASPQYILEAIRAGANEFLYPPLNETLHEAFQRLSESRSRSSNASGGGLGRIFGFLSAKGGCGATTFAAHVAPEVAKRVGSSTLLADFDFEAGILRFIMKSRSAWSVRDALDNMHRMDSNYWKKLVAPFDSKLDIIPAPDDLAARRSAGAQETAHLMRFIRSTYTASVIDFGRHVSIAANDSIGELDTLYLVTTGDLDTLDHARDCLRLFEHRGFPMSRVKVLLNRTPERGGVDSKALEDYLGFPCAGTFTADVEPLYDAWSEGRLLENNTKLGRELNALAATMAARVRGESEGPKPVAQPAPAATGLGRWFSFLNKSTAGQAAHAVSGGKR